MNSPPVLEFTGERVIPGTVDADLWNEHLSRYRFASRLSRNRRVVDLGCGSGYGSNELARTAARVHGIDNAYNAIKYCREHFSAPNLTFHVAACEHSSLPDSCADLVVAFELIEHLADPEALVVESRRLLTPGGQFILSTPNADFYRQTRQETGPNPFHNQEFTLDQLRSLLTRHFPYVTLFAQNHTAALAIQPLDPNVHSPGVIDCHPTGDRSRNAHFYLAICSSSPQSDTPLYVYVPQTANLLAERLRHIALLNDELHLKQQWLDRALADLAQLRAHLDRRDAELEEKIRHNQALRADLDQTASELGRRTAELEDKIVHVRILLKENAEFAAHITALQAGLNELEIELAQSREQAARLLAALQAAEQLAEERTQWALTLDAELANLRERLSLAASSRWLRLGRCLHLGPQL